jgi:REP-associated tyrosine transposase
MANTYSQIYIQVVFAPEGRQNLIAPKHREELQRYMTGIVTHQKHKLIAIYCMPDHVHILVGFRPFMALSDLVREIKADSCNFINQQKWFPGTFNWQEGYGAFSYGHSQLGSIISYIQNQESHHSRKTFEQEYVQFLKKFDVPYNPKYVFEIK